MDLITRLGSSWEQLAVVLVAGVVIYAWVIAATRLLGLRSFAKMSAFDFAMTVAIGSVIANAATGSVPLAAAVTAVAVLFGAQWLMARLRLQTPLNRMIDNRPLLLMYDDEIIDEHLVRARLTRQDLHAKLREANVLRVDDVRAVVFETTGDVNVLQGEKELEPRLLDGVRCGRVDLGRR